MKPVMTLVTLYLCSTCSLHSPYLPPGLSSPLVRTWRGEKQQQPGGRQRWSRWSEWSGCVVECGQGVVERRRRCRRGKADRRGRRKGRRVSIQSCVGEKKQLRVCYKGECEMGRDFKSKECAKFNNVSLFGDTIKTWEPATTWRGQCQLICNSKDHWLDLSYSFGRLKDGSECLGGVCVRGKCEDVGCDGVVGSGRVMDKCGECGGRGSTCTHVSHFIVITDSGGETGRRPRYSSFPPDQPGQSEHAENEVSVAGVGFHHILNIPRGATNIWIEDDSPLILALRNTEQRFILNGVYGREQEEDGFLLTIGEDSG